MLSKSFSERSRPAAFTLIEIAAALAILGTLLVGILLAKASHTRQLARAERKAGAVQAADRLIREWWHSAEGVPRNASGRVPDPRADRSGSFRWRTRVVERSGLRGLPARAVRITLSSAGEGPPDEDPLVAVTLVLPPPGADAGRGGS